MRFNYVFEHVYNNQNSSNTYKGGYAYKPEVDVTPHIPKTHLKSAQTYKGGYV